MGSNYEGRTGEWTPFDKRKFDAAAPSSAAVAQAEATHKRRAAVTASGTTASKRRKPVVDPTSTSSSQSAHNLGVPLIGSSQGNIESEHVSEFEPEHGHQSDEDTDDSSNS